MLKFIATAQRISTNVGGKARELANDRKGVTALEYSVIAAVTVVAIAGLLTTVSGSLTTLWGSINTALAG